MSGPHTEDPTLPALPSRLTIHYRKLLALHSNDPSVGVCLICCERSCDEWRWAYGQAFAAGELVGAHERWRDLVSVSVTREQGSP